jgi:signal transduction histidine kinase
MLFKRLDNQLLFITIAPTIFITLALSLFFLFDSLDNNNQYIEEKGQELSRQTLLLSEFYFYTGNHEELNKIAEMVFKNNDVRLLSFYNEKNQEIVELKKSDYRQSKYFEQSVYSIPTDLDDFSLENEPNTDNVIGKIVLGLSNQEMLSKEALVYKRIFLVILLAILGGLLLTYLFNRKLIAGLNALKQTAASIEEQNFDMRCEENGTGELLQIQKVFNQMADSVESNEDFLYKKVEEATRSLNQIIQELSDKNIELDQTRQRSISLERDKAIADERSRIMKDMHDGIGGQLISSLALIEREKDSPIKAMMLETLTRCIDDLRLIITSLSESANNLMALLADFKYRQTKRLEAMNIKLIWSVDDIVSDIDLQPQQSLHLLRILQEIFTNILKHANATEIELSSFQKGSKMIIQVIDNGQFALSEENKGHGITNMKWRAGQINASIEVTQSEQGGCSVTLSMPK